MKLLKWSETPKQLGTSSQVNELVAIALAEVGKGESLANNKGPDLDKYRSGDGTGRPVAVLGAWCASFLSWCIMKLFKGNPPFKTSRSAGTLGDNIAAYGKQYTVPAAGRFLVWDRGSKEWEKHIALCVFFDPATNICVLVDGNVGRYPSKVRVYASLNWQHRLEMIVGWDEE